MKCVVKMKEIMYFGNVKVKVLLLYSAARPDGFSSTLQPYPWQGIHPALV